MTATEWLKLVPRDTVVVRDGRRFDAGVSSVAETAGPGPSTVAGAIGAAYQQEPVEVRGPVLGREGRDGWTAYFPVPADLVSPRDLAGRVRRLRPERIDAVTDLAGGGATLLTGDGDALDGVLSASRLERYLSGDLLAAGRTAAADRVGVSANPLVAEARVGLAREDRVVRPGLLYQLTHQRLRDGWAYLAECALPDGWRATASGPVKLGGRDRQADVAALEGVSWPAAPATFPDGRLLLYLVTPAIWPGGWAPSVPGADLVAAAVRGPQPVATASEKDGFARSRRLWWAAPAGSVYLLRFRDGAGAAGRWSREWHGRAYGDKDDRLRTAGFGVGLTGVWS